MHMKIYAQFYNIRELKKVNYLEKIVFIIIERKSIITIEKFNMTGRFSI